MTVGDVSNPYAAEKYATLHQDESLSFLVIGAGTAGANHTRLLTGLGHAVSVCDVDLAKAEALAAKHGATPVREASGNYGAVVVAVPAAMHYDIICEQLELGNRVVSEKPLCLREWEAGHLAGEVEAGNLYIAESQCYGGADGLDIARMRDRIAAGEFGSPVMWRVCAMTQWRPQSWCDDLYLGGGAFLEGGVHVLTTARVLFGEAVRWQGSVRCFSGGLGPDSGTFLIDYAGGHQLTLQIGWGTEGCFAGECKPLRNSAGLIGPRQCLDDWWPGDDHAAMWGHLLKCLAGEAEPVATLQHAACAVQDCWRCYEAAGIV